MDENNFNFKIDNFSVLMENGFLFINDVEYEEDELDPTFSLVREIARLKGLIK